MTGMMEPISRAAMVMLNTLSRNGVSISPLIMTPKPAQHKTAISVTSVKHIITIRNWAK